MAAAASLPPSSSTPRPSSAAAATTSVVQLGAEADAPLPIDGSSHPSLLAIGRLVGRRLRVSFFVVVGSGDRKRGKEVTRQTKKKKKTQKPRPRPGGNFKKSKKKKKKKTGHCLRRPRALRGALVPRPAGQPRALRHADPRGRRRRRRERRGGEGGGTLLAVVSGVGNSGSNTSDDGSPRAALPRRRPPPLAEQSSGPEPESKAGPRHGDGDRPAGQARAVLRRGRGLRDGEGRHGARAGDGGEWQQLLKVIFFNIFCLFVPL